jgi:uncharacterized repeat protein (TIGR04138 family)
MGNLLDPNAASGRLWHQTLSVSTSAADRPSPRGDTLTTCMQTLDFDQTVETIIEHDSRYAAESYYFLRDALDYTQRQIKKRQSGAHQPQHVSGCQLLEGIRDHALTEFGPMTHTVLSEWGLSCCEDFGEIVFNMVEHKLLSKTEEDSREDFKSIFTFEEAFTKPFMPKIALTRKSPQTRVSVKSKRKTKG